MTLVSVVIPSYNHEPFLTEAVESVLAFDGDLELIVVDDGSTDRSLELLAEYSTEKRVRVEKQPNQGAHVALNRGLSLARGEILFILNSDDRFAPRRIGSFLQRFDEEPALLTLASWIQLIDEEGNPLGVKKGDSNLPPWPPRPGGARLSQLGDPRLSLLETNYLATSSNLAFRRELLDHPGVEFPALRYTHDWYFALAAATAGGLELIAEPLIDYRVHSANTIKEGAEPAEGNGDGQAPVNRMHFEIAWTLAAHSQRLRDTRVRENGLDSEDLARRQWLSLPPFVSRGRFAQLLLLRDRKAAPPTAYSALLLENHPLGVEIVTSPQDPGPEGPALSVVIPTRDRLEVLYRTLEDLAAEVTHRPIEVLVIDDGSETPPPDAWRDEFAELDLQIHHRPPFGPAAARNFGIDRATAQRVLLLGDDTPLKPGCLAAHLDPAYAQLGVQGRIDWDPQEPITDLMRFLAPDGPQFYFTKLRDGEVVPYTSVLGSNLSAPARWFRREPFDEGFPHASFEDTELAYRWAARGWDVVFVESAGAWHRHHYETIQPFLQRQHRAGAAARYGIGRHGAMMLWPVVLAPAIVTLLRSLRPRRTREERWDLACRYAFLRGFLARPLSSSRP